MTSIFSYILKFDVNVNAVELAWPDFDSPSSGLRYVVALSGTLQDGEPCPSTATSSPFSEVLGSPYQYLISSTVGARTENIEFFGEGIRSLEILLRPWGRDDHPPFVASSMKLYASATTALPHRRVITTINEGQQA